MPRKRDRNKPASLLRIHNESYPEGRICAYPGCNTKLSIYNSGDCCWPHERYAYVSPMEKQPRVKREVTHGYQERECGC